MIAYRNGYTFPYSLTAICQHRPHYLAESEDRTSKQWLMWRCLRACGWNDNCKIWTDTGDLVSPQEVNIWHPLYKRPHKIPTSFLSFEETQQPTILVVKMTLKTSILITKYSPPQLHDFPFTASFYHASHTRYCFLLNTASLMVFCQTSEAEHTAVNICNFVFVRYVGSLAK